MASAVRFLKTRNQAQTICESLSERCLWTDLAFGDVPASGHANFFSDRAGFAATSALAHFCAFKLWRRFVSIIRVLLVCPGHTVSRISSMSITLLICVAINLMLSSLTCAGNETKHQSINAVFLVWWCSHHLTEANKKELQVSAIPFGPPQLSAFEGISS